jgi:hypothetical protein
MALEQLARLVLTNSPELRSTYPNQRVSRSASPISVSTQYPDVSRECRNSQRTVAFDLLAFERTASALLCGAERGGRDAESCNE